jgi:O-antigen ligase
MERLAFTGRFPARAATSRARQRYAAVPAAVELRNLAVARKDHLAFLALLAFTFVLFIRPQDTLPFLQPIPVGDITATAAVLALVSGRMARGEPILRFPPELIAVLALAGVMLATAPFSLWPGGAIGVFTDLYSKVILIFALMVNLVTTRERFDRFVNIVVLGTSYIGIRAVIDYARGVNLVEGDRIGGAVGGLFGNPNDMALNMVAFLPLAVAVVLGRGTRVLRLTALIGLPAIAAAIVFSKSRGGTVGLVAMLMVLLYQMRRIRPGVAALVVAAGFASMPMLPSSFTDRMASIYNPDEDPTGSREARKRLLREGYQAFLDHPMFGLGAGQFPNYKPYEREESWRETHNAVLQVAAELGIGGLTVFVAIIASGFVAVLGTASALRRTRRRRNIRAPDGFGIRREPLELYSAALAASLAGWFVAALFASVAYYWTFYIVLGLAVGLREIAQREMHSAAEVRLQPCRIQAA